MKSVTKPQRALCAKALRHYANALVAEHAEYGNLTLEDFKNVGRAEELADQFEKESRS